MIHSVAGTEGERWSIPSQGQVEGGAGLILKVGWKSSFQGRAFK